MMYACVGKFWSSSDYLTVADMMDTLRRSYLLGVFERRSIRP